MTEEEIYQLTPAEHEEQGKMHQNTIEKCREVSDRIDGAPTIDR